MVNRLFAFCASYQANKPECRILQEARGSPAGRDGNISPASSTLDQKICETCPSRDLEVERPECVNCGGYIIREGTSEAGTAGGYRYRCYKCNLTFSSTKKFA
jgi:hypothetical protein